MTQHVYVVTSRDSYARDMDAVHGVFTTYDAARKFVVDDNSVDDFTADLNWSEDGTHAELDSEYEYLITMHEVRGS